MYKIYMNVKNHICNDVSISYKRYDKLILRRTTMINGRNALAVAASITLGVVIWLGPLCALWLSPIGTTKAWRMVSDRCGGPDVTPCTIEIPNGYPAADLVVVPVDF
jgi:hypothetical protein